VVGAVDILDVVVDVGVALVDLPVVMDTMDVEALELKVEAEMLPLTL